MYLQGTVSNTYRIEWAGNLNTPALVDPLFNVTQQTNPQFIFDPTPATGTRFYRVFKCRLNNEVKATSESFRVVGMGGRWPVNPRPPPPPKLANSISRLE